MAKVHDNLIETTTGFKFAGEFPPDDREVVAKYTDLADLVTNHLVYEGMRVYVVEKKESYQYVGTEWKPFAQGSIVQETGYRTDAIMSQKAVTDLVYPFGSDMPVTKKGALVSVAYPAELQDITVQSQPNRKVILTNRNLFKLWDKYVVSTNRNYTNGGITAVEDGGKFTLNGTATTNAQIYLSASYNAKSEPHPGRCKAGHYMVSLNATLPEGVTCQFAAYYVGDVPNTTSGSQTFTWMSDQGEAKMGKSFVKDFYFQICINIPAGVTLQNFVVRPQLEPGHFISGWIAPYRLESLADGSGKCVFSSPGIPNMLAFADSYEDIEVTYMAALNVKNTFDDITTSLDRKVERITADSYLYGTDEDGNSTSYKVTKAPYNRGVVLRDEKSQINLPEVAPKAGAYQAISRKHVEDIVSSVNESITDIVDGETEVGKATNATNATNYVDGDEKKSIADAISTQNSIILDLYTRLEAMGFKEGVATAYGTTQLWRGTVTTDKLYKMGKYVYADVTVSYANTSNGFYPWNTAVALPLFKLPFQPKEDFTISAYIRLYIDGSTYCYMPCIVSISSLAKTVDIKQAIMGTQLNEPENVYIRDLTLRFGYEAVQE